MDFTVDLTQEAVVPLAADWVDDDATAKPAAADQAADVDLISPVQPPHGEKTEEKGKILRSDNLRHYHHLFIFLLVKSWKTFKRMMLLDNKSIHVIYIYTYICIFLLLVCLGVVSVHEMNRQLPACK